MWDQTAGCSGRRFKRSWPTSRISTASSGRFICLLGPQERVSIHGSETGETSRTVLWKLGHFAVSLFKVILVQLSVPLLHFSHYLEILFWPPALVHMISPWTCAEIFQVRFNRLYVEDLKISCGFFVHLSCKSSTILEKNKTTSPLWLWGLLTLRVNMTCLHIKVIVPKINQSADCEGVRTVV